MATLEEAYSIVSDLTAKLRMPPPQIMVSPPKVPLYSPSAFLGRDGLRISPEALDQLSVGQLRICLAYAIVNSQAAKKSSNIVFALCLAVILPFGTIYTLTTAEGSSGLPGWFWPAAVFGLALYFFAGYLVALRTARQTDSGVFGITNDLPGIREYLLAGGYYKKSGVPVVPKPGSVEKRLANLQGF